MAGTDEKVSMIDDWNFPYPSPRTLMSSYLSEEFASRSFSDFLAGKENEGIPSALEVEKMDMVAKVEVVETANDLPFEPSQSGAHKANTHGGLAERIAANGFNVPKLNTAFMVSANMASSSSNARSPYLTIPPGLSPTSLLESPVFLSNSMAQPSPTTGKLQFAQNGYTGASLINPAASNKRDNTLEDASESFVFKPTLEKHSSYSSSERKVVPDFGHLQTLPIATVSAQLGNHKKRVISEVGTMDVHNEEFSFQSDIKDIGANIFNQRATNTFMGSIHSVPSDNSQQDEDMDLKEELSSMSVGAPAEDGYNWRKYGQKQVKGSEYPRSYYKCTNPNCQVKKKVERSQEGQITEITYKGVHKHPKPPPNRRSGVLLSHSFNDPKIDGSEQIGLQMSSDRKPMWASPNIVNEGQDWQGDCLETHSSAHVAAENCDPSNTRQILHGPHFSSDAIDVSSTVSNDEDEDDCATLGSVSQGCDGEGDETESKRIKSDTSTIEMNAASRAVREPRVVVQTTSEVDILDDGYRWRKYGQKVVKGNPNPRSYYKCTHPGCNVRKHVERAAHDLKSVITTYEGKHNHEVPAARNSGQLNSATPNSTTTTAPQPHSLLARADPAQAGLMRFEGHAPLSTAFGFPGAEQLRPITNFTFAMGQPGLPNLAMIGLRSLTPMGMAVHPSVHSYLGHRPPIEGGFMIPKGEPNAEPTPESSLSMLNTGSMHPQKMMNGV